MNFVKCTEHFRTRESRILREWPLRNILLIDKIVHLIDQLVKYRKKFKRRLQEPQRWAFGRGDLYVHRHVYRQMSGVRYLLAPMAGLAGDLRELSFFEVFEDFAIDFLRHDNHEARDVFAGIFV